MSQTHDAPSSQAALARAPWGLRTLARAPLPLLRALGWGVGRLLYGLAWPRRRVVFDNLQRCFPEQPQACRRRVAKQVFVHFAQSWLDRLWLWHADEAVLRQRLQLTGDVTALQSAQAQVLFAPHFMGLDAGWTVLTLKLARPMVTLYARHPSPTQDRWIAQGRSRFAPQGLLPRVGSVKAAVKAMRQGAALYLLPDMDLGAHNAVFVPFMGNTAATVTALPRFAALGHAPVLAVRTLMTPTGYETQVGASWPDYPTGDDLADATYMNAFLEAWVREHPEQYYWVHRRFKTQPK